MGGMRNDDDDDADANANIGGWPNNNRQCLQGTDARHRDLPRGFIFKLLQREVLTVLSTTQGRSQVYRYIYRDGLRIIQAPPPHGMHAKQQPAVSRCTYMATCVFSCPTARVPPTASCCRSDGWCIHGARCSHPIVLEHLESNASSIAGFISSLST